MMLAFMASSASAQQPPEQKSTVILSCYKVAEDGRPVPSKFNYLEVTRDRENGKLTVFRHRESVPYLKTFSTIYFGFPLFNTLFNTDEQSQNYESTQFLLGRSENRAEMLELTFNTLNQRPDGSSEGILKEGANFGQRDDSERPPSLGKYATSRVGCRPQEI